MVESRTPSNRFAIPTASDTPTRRSLRESARLTAPRRGSAVAPPAYSDGATRGAAAKKPLQHRVVGALTVLLVPGILVGTSIPAFAVGSASTGASDASLFSANGQSLVVASAGEGLDLARDAFDATTEAELEAARAAERRTVYTQSAAATSGTYSSVTPRQAGDDYPYRSRGGLSPMGYVMRQCTDFVAWRINRDAGYTSNYKYVWAKMTPNGGNASGWAAGWRQNGWKTSHKPVKGAVAWFYGNHVAYVKSVDGSKVHLEEYNWGGDGSYHSRTVAVDDVALYLYPPP